jgi:hypothetical protein
MRIAPARRRAACRRGGRELARVVAPAPGVPPIPKFFRGVTLRGAASLVTAGTMSVSDAERVA